MSFFLLLLVISLGIYYNGLSLLRKFIETSHSDSISLSVVAGLQRLVVLDVSLTIAPQVLEPMLQPIGGYIWLCNIAMGVLQSAVCGMLFRTIMRSRWSLTRRNVGGRTSVKIDIGAVAYGVFSSVAAISLSTHGIFTVFSVNQVLSLVTLPLVLATLYLIYSWARAGLDLDHPLLNQAVRDLWLPAGTLLVTTII